MAYNLYSGKIKEEFEINYPIVINKNDNKIKQEFEIKNIFPTDSILHNNVNIGAYKLKRISKLEMNFNFIEKNFLLNFSFIILAIFLPHNSDITIGLIGSYLFFIITSVYEEYRNEIGNNIEYNRKNIILQLLLNMSLCNSFILIEKSISMIYSNNFEYPINPFVFAINNLITIILIALNYFLSNNEEKKTPLKQKIKTFTSTCISKK